MCFSQYFPLLVGDLVPEDDEKWVNFLQIMEYIFASVTTEDKILYFEVLIGEFLSEFVHLYPDRPLIHYYGACPILDEKVETIDCVMY